MVAQIQASLETIYLTKNTIRTTNVLRKLNADKTNSYITISYQISKILTSYVAVTLKRCYATLKSFCL